MTAAELIANGQPFCVVHKLSYGRDLYLTDNATWSTCIENAAAFETDQDAQEFIGLLDPELIGRGRPSPVEYFRNGTVGVSA